MLAHNGMTSRTSLRNSDEVNQCGSLMLGLIAQDVEETSPGLVEEVIDRDENGNDLGKLQTKNVSYFRDANEVVVALQELTENRRAETKVKELESKV